MNILYHSTRNNDKKITASQAVLQGLAEDGGLFVPERLPALDVSLDALKEMDYQGVAYEVMKLFLTDYTEEELKYCISHAYDKKFDTEEIAPLVYADGVYYLELFHGSTIAFKDMALSILPYLMTTAARKNGCGEEIVILTATSGDTGKAALAGFADVPGTRIVVFYPKHGVSAVQEKQMVTQRGGNVRVIGITGNFDDAQTGVKQMFNDAALKAELKEHGFVFSSANSINIGRLVPQVVYYVYAYVTLLKNGKVSAGEPINVCVPTGNFGNILAAYFAKHLGVPIAKLICASNTNKVLFDFFKTGTYDKLHALDEQSGAFSAERKFMLTGSPSMDILISSNLERLIYLVGGCDDAKDKALMQELKEKGAYTITEEMKAKLADFVGGYADEARTAEKIRTLYEDTGYIIDPHTAVAAAVQEDYGKASGDRTVTVVASTASPYKFARTVLSAIDPVYAGKEDFDLIDILNEKSGVEIPQAIEDIRSAKVLHDIVCETEEMPAQVKAFLGIYTS
ncbi:MAG: threonine synthase [Lachnospiraceae bacterium]|nr:threonine synthase [Lachnospiraceae bacterium]